MAKKSPFLSNSIVSNDQTRNFSSPDSNPVRMSTASASSGALDPSASAGPSKVESPKKAKTAAKKTGAPQSAIPINVEDEIRRRAYELSAERGFSSGHETEDWLRAEREVMQRYEQARSA